MPKRNDKSYKLIIWEEGMAALEETKSLYGRIVNKEIDLQTAKELNYANRTRAAEIGQMTRLAPLMD
jgi:hypothetical protein